MAKTEKRSLFRKTMTWAGIIFTGLCGIVLFGGDKVTSGIVLVVTMIIMIVPIRQNRILRRVRVAFVCVVFALVIWNISTTDVPGYDGIKMMSGEQGDAYVTGVKFIDQLIWIFKGFLKGRVFQHKPL